MDVNIKLLLSVPGRARSGGAMYCTALIVIKWSCTGRTTRARMERQRPACNGLALINSGLPANEEDFRHFHPIQTIGFADVSPFALYQDAYQE